MNKSLLQAKVSLDCQAGGRHLSVADLQRLIVPCMAGLTQKAFAI